MVVAVVTPAAVTVAAVVAPAAVVVVTPAAVTVAAPMVVTTVVRGMRYHRRRGGAGASGAAYQDGGRDAQRGGKTGNPHSVLLSRQVPNAPALVGHIHIDVRNAPLSPTRRQRHLM